MHWGSFLLGLLVWPTLLAICGFVLYGIGKRELNRQTRQLEAPSPSEIVDELLETLGKN